MSSLLFSLAVVVALVGLLFWARWRAKAIRERSDLREQEAMALLLAAGAPNAGVAGGASADERRAPGESFVRQGSGPAARRAGPDEAHGAAPNVVRSTTTQTAAAMDPIEELISQIEVDPPSRGAAAPSPVRARTTRPVSAPAPVPEERSKPEPIGAGVPLRALALAWYESRGYRGSPASPAVWPIEMVLRHRDDATRAYAFVVQYDHISVDRITALIEQAREIGMVRVAVVAEAGYERGARDIARRRHVRLIDRSTMDAELAALALPTAARIIAVARTRASAEGPAAA